MIIRVSLSWASDSFDYIKVCMAIVVMAVIGRYFILISFNNYFVDATKFGKTTLSIMTLSIMTLSIMTLSLTTPNIKGIFVTLSKNALQHK